MSGNDRGLPPLIPDLSGWFEGLFPQPQGQQGPMVKGKPQEAAGSPAPGTGIEAAIEGVINRLLGRIFSPEHVRDATVYLGVGALVLLALWAALK